MADAQDRLFLDLNGDGRFDPTAEQFLFATILNLEGTRTIVRSDLLGTRLQLDPLEGTGTLRLELKPNELNKSAKVAEMRATVLGRDGSVFGLTGGEATTVPAGEYRMGNLTIALEDAKSGEVWTFNFSDGMWSGEQRLVQGRQRHGGRDRPDRKAQVRAEAIRVGGDGEAGG